MSRGCGAAAAGAAVWAEAGSAVAAQFAGGAGLFGFLAWAFCGVAGAVAAIGYAGVEAARSARCWGSAFSAAWHARFGALGYSEDAVPAGGSAAWAAAGCVAAGRCAGGAGMCGSSAWAFCWVAGPVAAVGYAGVEAAGCARSWDAALFAAWHARFGAPEYPEDAVPGEDSAAWAAAGTAAAAECVCGEGSLGSSAEGRR